MPKRDNIRAALVQPSQDLCSCQACGASNKITGTDVFDLKADKIHIRLCRACLWELIESAGQALAASEPAPGWAESVCRDVLGTDKAEAPQTERLKAELAVIPELPMYACLVARYAGMDAEDVKPRGRDEGHELPIMSSMGRTKAADAAMAFLQEPSRAAFIRDGATDLYAVFRMDDARMLQSAGIYVQADLAAYDDAEILSIQGMTLETAAICDVVRREAISRQDKKEGRA